MSEVKVGDRFLRLYRFVECEVEYEVRAIDGDTAWISTRDTDGDLSYDSVPVFRLLHSDRFRRIEPFFEVGKKYCSTTYSVTPWEILMISERDGERAAWATRKAGERVEWMTLVDFECFEEVND